MEDSSRQARPGPPALILGAHIAALGTLRRLSARGIECRVLDETSDIITRSRWYVPAERCLPETSDGAVLASHLESLDMGPTVVIPCSDAWTMAVAALPEETRSRFMASVPPRSAVEDFVDKERFGRLVERLGIPHPRTALIRTPDDLDALPDAHVADGFLKPVESQLHNRLYGTKGRFVHSRDEAREAVEDALRKGITFMFQEWIPGPPGATILLDGFVDRAGAIRAVSARRRIRMHPPRLANTTCDVMIPLGDVAEAVTDARRLLDAVAYRGIFNIEFKHDSRDGRFRIIELNPRPFWLIAHIAAAGLDLPWMAYLDAQGLPVPDVTSYHVGRYGMYEFQEIAALVHAWRSLRRPDGPVLAPWLRGDHTLLSWRDPMPGLAAVRRAAGNRLARARARKLETPQAGAARTT